jgi:hypothetical protein
MDVHGMLFQATLVTDVGLELCSMPLPFLLEAATALETPQQ